MIIETKQYLKHSYLNGGLSLLKFAIFKLFGLISSNAPLSKAKPSFLAKGAKSYYPVLELLDNDTLKCVSCGLCEKICPTKCIDITKNKSMSISSSTVYFGPAPDEFKIDLKKCIQCGLCEEVCPVVAITMTGEYNLLNHSEKFWNRKELQSQSKPPKQEF